MALKQEPINIDSESCDSPRILSAHSDTITPMTSPCPVNFLTDQAGSEVILDPMQEDVVFLPHRATGGRGHHRHRTREVTEYANYTISHLEAEVNSKHLPKKYRCRFCIYKTSYKSDLNRHLRKHGIAPRHCPLCNMPFKTTGNLENHIRQAHIDVAENMGIMPSSLSTMCLKGVFVPPVAMASSPGLMNLASGSHAVQLSAADPCLEQQALQLHKDFPALSQAVLSPAQLHCHMCPFVCSDSQVLAGHILTHPGEEEVSRTVQSSQINATDMKHACHGCGQVLDSMDELQVHKLSCLVNSEDSNQGEQRTAQSEDKDKVDKGKHNGKEAGNKHGLARQETMNKLRRVITNQSENNDSHSDSLSSSRQTFSKQKEKRSMILPHIPAAEVNSEKADQKENESSPVHTVSETSHTESVIDNQGQSNLLTSAVEDRVSRRKQNYRGVTSRETVMSVPHEDMSQLITGKNRQSETGLEKKKQDSNMHSWPCQSERRHSSTPVSSHDRNPERSVDAFSKETADQHESVSCKVKRVSLSADCHTAAIKPSGKDHPGKQYTCKTVTVKEEPKSPDASMEFEGVESSEAYEEDSKTDPLTTRLDLATSPSSCERHERECSLCDEPFRDRAHLFMHVQHVHIQAASAPSSVRAQAAVSSSLSDNTFSLPKSPNQFHFYHTTSQNEETAGQSPQRQFHNQSGLPRSPSRGRYARLVSDFDDFASKPYACSLCFFRTSRLSELSVHVHNHLTGGSSTPPPETARFQPRESFYVERGSSPWKTDSEDLPSFKSVVVSDPPNSSAAVATCGNGTGFRTSCGQSVKLQPSTVEHSKRKVLLYQETDDQTGKVVGKSSSVPIAASNSTTSSNTCHHTYTTVSADLIVEPCPSGPSAQTVEVVPNMTTTVLSDDDVIVSLTRDDLSDDDDDEVSSAGCADTALMDSGNNVQSDQTQGLESQNIGKTHHSSSDEKKSPPVKVGNESTHGSQRKPTSPTITGVSVFPDSNIFENKVPHTTEDTFLEPLNPSSEKSTRKICRKARLRALKSNLLQVAKREGKRRVPKNRNTWWKFGKAKKGQWWNSVSLQKYRCVDCEQSFSVRQLLSRHVRHVHSVSVASPSKES